MAGFRTAGHRQFVKPRSDEDGRRAAGEAVGHCPHAALPRPQAPLTTWRGRGAPGLPVHHFHATRLPGSAAAKPVGVSGHQLSSEGVSLAVPGRPPSLTGVLKAAGAILHWTRAPPLGQMLCGFRQGRRPRTAGSGKPRCGPGLRSPHPLARRTCGSLFVRSSERTRWPPRGNSQDPAGNRSSTGRKAGLDWVRVHTCICWPQGAARRSRPTPTPAPTTLRCLPWQLRRQRCP